MKIGTRPAPGPVDVVDTLLACHERIRGFTALAARLAAAEAPSDTDIVDAAARVARYFTEALPLHVRDEDESLAPRLRGCSPEVDAALDALEREHRAHEPLVARVVALCAEMRDAPARHAAARAALGEAAAALDAAFREHLAREERVLFPAVRAALSAQERDAIAREVRARREGGA